MDAEIERVLVANHRKFLAFLERRVGGRQEAEDLLQSAFARALERGTPAPDESGIVSWFYAVLRHGLADHFRRADVKTRALAREATIATEAVDPELKAAVCACMYDLLPSLKPEYADVVREVDLKERPIAEVARALGITTNNANVRLHRARQALKRQLQKSCAACAVHGCLECSCRGATAR